MGPQPPVALAPEALRRRVDRRSTPSDSISNPLIVIEQITYQLFIKRLDELHTLKELQAARTGKPIEDPVVTAEQDHLRWSPFKQADPDQMFNTALEKVFPFIKSLGGNSQPVATAHFLQLTDEHFERAVLGDFEATQSAAQKPHEMSRDASKDKSRTNAQGSTASALSLRFLDISTHCEMTRIPRRGVEPLFSD